MHTPRWMTSLSWMAVLCMRFDDAVKVCFADNARARLDQRGLEHIVSAGWNSAAPILGGGGSVIAQ
jgi:hypothetical protein